MKTGAVALARCRSRRAPRKGRLALAVTAAAAVLLIAPSAALAASGIPGQHRWADTVSSGSGDGYDNAVAVATNAAGDAIVVGDVGGNGLTGHDIHYRSYSSDGALRWDATWDGAGGNDQVAGVVVDKARNCVYVAGTTESADGDDDYVLLKLRDSADGSSPAGEVLWERTFNAAVGGDEVAQAVTRDKYGNVYITGISQRSDRSRDLHLVKYRPNGTLAWARRHDNGGGRGDFGRAIAVRGDRLFVAGESERPGTRGVDVVLLRYSLGGSKRWVRYCGSSTNHDHVAAMALTSSSLYVCGGGQIGPRWDDALMIKYGHDGRKKWVRWTAGRSGCAGRPAAGATMTAGPTSQSTTRRACT